MSQSTQDTIEVYDAVPGSLKLTKQAILPKDYAPVWVALNEDGLPGHTVLPIEPFDKGNALKEKPDSVIYSTSSTNSMEKGYPNLWNDMLGAIVRLQHQVKIGVDLDIINGAFRYIE